MELIARSGTRIDRISIERTSSGEGPSRYRIVISAGSAPGDEARAARVHDVEARALGAFVKSLLVDGASYETAVFRSGDAAWSVGWRGRTTKVELVDPLTHLATESRGDADRGGRRVIAAYMPGRVVAIAVAVGAAVEPGQPLVVLEAMKMQNEIQADRAGTVTKIHVAAGEAVEGGDPLVEIS